MTQRILFDACTPSPLSRCFSEEVRIDTAQKQGWGKLENGKLQKKAADNRFAAFVTVDTDFADESQFSSHPLPTFLLRAAPELRIPALEPLIPVVEQTLEAGAENKLYIYDNFHGEIMVSSSWEESEDLRKQTSG